MNTAYPNELDGVVNGYIGKEFGIAPDSLLLAVTVIVMD